MSTNAAALKALAAIFKERGVVRRPSLTLAGRNGTLYHKGYEVRFPMRSVEDAAKVQGLLRKAGLKPGAPFLKRRLVVVPVYGIDAVKAFDRALAKPAR
ncbi:MAG: hypothetical protein ACKVU4_14220 [Phycisphaerales bacterium]